MQSTTRRQHLAPRNSVNLRNNDYSRFCCDTPTQGHPTDFPLEMSAMMRSMRATHLKVGLRLLPRATASALGTESRRFLASSAEAASTETSTSSSEPTRHVKLKSSLKRARGLAAKLRIEAKERRAAFLHDWRPDLPDFGVGDAIEVTVRHNCHERPLELPECFYWIIIFPLVLHDIRSMRTSCLLSKPTVFWVP